MQNVWQQRVLMWLNRRIPAANHHRLDLKKVFIFPSTFGGAFLVLIAALFVLGTNYQNNLMLLLGYLLLALMLINLFVSYLNFSRLHITLGKLTSSYVGEPGLLPLWFNSETGQKSPSGILKLHFWQQKNALQFDLDQQQNPCVLTTTCQQRGKLRFPRVTINSYYPLGLFRCWSHLDFNAQILVYPKPLPSIVKLHPQPAQQDWTDSDTNQPGQDEFHSLKNYQVGEPLNHVAWKQVAKGQGMLSKEFSRHTSGEHYLILKAHAPADLEKQLGQLCFAVNSLSQQGQRFGLCLGHHAISPDRGQNHRQRCLAALACYGLNDDDQ